MTEERHDSDNDEAINCPSCGRLIEEKGKCPSCNFVSNTPPEKESEP